MREAIFHRINIDNVTEPWIFVMSPPSLVHNMQRCIFNAHVIDAVKKTKEVKFDKIVINTDSHNTMQLHKNDVDFNCMP